MKIFINDENEEYNSFIYIWYDLKENKKYIGSHIGNTNDGYKFSGILIKKEFISRPDDFVREILSYHLIKSQKEIRKIEEYYLKLNDVENNDNYYNQTNKAYGGYHKKSVEKRLNDIDENGLNAFKRASIKMVETRKTNNSYETSKIKEMKTKKENLNHFKEINKKISKTLTNSIWINNDNERKYIKETELNNYINNGWKIGIKHNLTLIEYSNIAKENNIKSIKQWQLFAKENNYVFNPDRKFKKEWINWNIFLQK
jgi:tRNA nucleotidyltransferase/poly(A) polymerase